MAATGLDMTKRALLLCLLAAGAGWGADDPNRATKIALANALHSGDAKAAVRLFDPGMHGFSALRAGLEGLLGSAEVNLSIDVETGVWSLAVTSRDLATGATLREAKVGIVVKNGLIQSLDPADFFAPPHGREAWDTLFSFAADLQNEDAAPRLGQFDHSMPGFEDFSHSVAALWARFQLEPSLDLRSNEGGDADRTLQIGWTLRLKNPQDPVDSTVREQIVVCRVKKQGKSWRIVSFTPADFFALPQK